MAEPKRKWANLNKLRSRTQLRIDNNLGIIRAGTSTKYRPCRREFLDMLDQYLCSKQYDKLVPWDGGSPDEYTPIRNRKPRMILAFPKMLCDRVTAKLVGSATYPALSVEDDPDTTAFLDVIAKHSHVKTYVQEAVRKCLGIGSSFLRYYLVGGQIKMEIYNSKYCYPEFDELGELQQVEIRYIYEDHEDRDEKGDPKKKWFRMLLTKNSDILFDNPLATEQEPTFNVVGQADHNLGFVQGEWFRTGEDKHNPDGPSLIADILDFCDELNYNFSQSSQASSYAQEPQLTIAGMDVNEIDELIRSSTKAWNLGRDGKAAFLEANMNGIKAADELRCKVRENIADISRVVLLSPEKIVGSAQSAKAMEVLHGPLIELVDELRPRIEKSIVDLMLKMAVTLLMMKQAGAQDLAVVIPDGYVPKSLNVTASWPPIFPLTMEDLLKKVQVAVQAGNASIVSRETLTRWVAKDFGIENIEEEISKVAAQPQLNPFGSF